MKTCKICRIFGWIAAGIVAALMAYPAISKIFLMDEAVGNFQFFHLSPYLQVVGGLELLAVILLLIPRTTLTGAVLISSLMSGAVFAHLSLLNGTGVYLPIIVGVLSWVSYLLRNKKILCSKQCSYQSIDTKTSHL